MTVPFVSFEDGESVLDWIGLCDALEAGHRLPKAEIGDTFLYRDPDTMLSRAATSTSTSSSKKSPGTLRPLTTTTRCTALF